MFRKKYKYKEKRTYRIMILALIFAMIAVRIITRHNFGVEPDIEEIISMISIFAPLYVVWFAMDKLDECRK